MTERRWIVLTFGTILAAIITVAAIGYVADPYGVLRDPAGRKLNIYMADRKAKFLMSKRYVPENFNGLLIGASETLNWDVPNLAGAKIYNESLPGASASEERFVVDQALAKGHFKLVILVLTPAATRRHSFQDGLDRVTTSEAIGSIHSIVNSTGQVLSSWHFGVQKDQSSPYGTEPFFIPVAIDVGPVDSSFFRIDPVALEDLRSLLLSLQDRGARIVYVVPPVYKPQYDLNRGGFKTYLQSMRQALPPGPVIDFNDTEYAGLTGNRGLFYDCVHMKPEGASEFSALLERLAPETIAAAR